MTFAWQNNFPSDIIGLAPLNRRICMRGNAIGQRTPPLRPAILRRNATHRLSTQHRKRGQQSDYEH
jgi:hypothetical protein